MNLVKGDGVQGEESARGAPENSRYSSLSSAMEVIEASGIRLSASLALYAFDARALPSVDRCLELR